MQGFFLGALHFLLLVGVIKMGGAAGNSEPRLGEWSQYLNWFELQRATLL